MSSSNNDDDSKRPNLLMGNENETTVDEQPVIDDTTGKLIISANKVTSTIVPISKFLPLVTEIENNVNEIVEIVQTAEHNERTCMALLRRVRAIDLVVFELKIQRNNQEFLNKKNYL